MGELEKVGWITELSIYLNPHPSEDHRCWGLVFPLTGFTIGEIGVE